MLKLHSSQRALLANKFADVANLAVGALTFGQFLGAGPLSLAVALSGVALWIALVALAVIFAPREKA